MDEREERQLRAEFDVDEVITLDMPVWYLNLTSRVTGRWRREVAVVGAAFASGIAVGAAAVLAAGRL